MSFASVTVKHGTKTLIAQQVLEIDPTADFKQLYHAAVEEARASTSWSREEWQLMQDDSNLEDAAQVSNSQDRNGGAPCCHGTMSMHIGV